MSEQEPFSKFDDLLAFIPHAKKIIEETELDMMNPNAPMIMQWACTFGHLDIIKKLFFKGYPPQLDLTKESRQTLLFDVGSTEVIRCLVQDCRVDVNAVNSEGMTPLHYYAEHGEANFVRELLYLNANPQIVDNKGYTALSRAMAASADPIYKLNENCDHESVIRLLRIRRGGFGGCLAIIIIAVIIIYFVSK